MFFIGVFGVENKEKEIKTLDYISCKNCNKTIVGKKDILERYFNGKFNK